MPDEPQGTDLQRQLQRYADAAWQEILRVLQVTSRDAAVELIGEQRIASELRQRIERMAQRDGVRNPFRQLPPTEVDRIVGLTGVAREDDYVTPETQAARDEVLARTMPILSGEESTFQGQVESTSPAAQAERAAEGPVPPPREEEEDERELPGGSGSVRRRNQDRFTDRERRQREALVGIESGASSARQRERQRRRRAEQIVRGRPGRRPRGFGLLEDLAAGRLSRSGAADAQGASLEQLAALQAAAAQGEDLDVEALLGEIASTAQQQQTVQDPLPGGGLFGGGDQGVEIRGTRRGTGVIAAGTGPVSRFGTPINPRDLLEGRVDPIAQGESPSIIVPTAVASSLTENQRKYLPFVIDMAHEYGVPVGVLFGLLNVESGFNPDAVSPTNPNGTRDYGIAQINSYTLAGMGKSVNWAMNPFNAIRYAAERLANSIAKYGSVAAALIEYNGGAARADEYMRTGQWPYERAEAYVNSVLDAAKTLDPLNMTDYEIDGPQVEMRDILDIQLTSPADIRTIAETIATRLLGRTPTADELQEIVEVVQDREKQEQIHAFNQKLFTNANQEQAVTLTATGPAPTPQSVWGTPDGGVSWANGQQVWGGLYENGFIPQEQLVQVDGGWLHPAAADAFRAMQAAAAAEGIHISLGSGYRSYSQQAAVKESKPHLAASAGRSIHGWGLAADVNGVGGFNTKAYRWLQENALRFGWTNPSWARAGGSKPEHWHWEFIGGPGASTGPLLSQTTTTTISGLIDDVFRQRYPDEIEAFSYAKQAQVLLNMITQGGVPLGA